MLWELSSQRYVYIQLIEHIQNMIITGVYKPGEKLPSVRNMAAEAGVNPNTMQKSLMELERAGLVFTNRTSGRYITTDEALIRGLKNQYIKGQINELLEKIEQFGFESEEVLELITEAISAKKNKG
jgi:DNA-binding transcriptional regulator YhcF (GntR family)